MNKKEIDVFYVTFNPLTNQDYYYNLFLLTKISKEKNENKLR